MTPARIDNPARGRYCQAMPGKILYAGDTSLRAAASYLGGILTHYGLGFDYLPSDQPIGPALAAGHALYILSDYPVNNIRSGDFDVIVEAVRGGAGLLMIGGWESFHGLAGEYHNSPLVEVLPVEMQRSDDRVNSAQPCMIEKLRPHPIVDGLPLERPPNIGGYNRVTAKKTATQVLAVRHLEIAVSGQGEYRLSSGQAFPLLVTGTFGRGRTAAFTSDVAPHWVGGLVDWGQPRLTAQAPGGDKVEIGCHYAEFFRRLAAWTMGRM